MTAQVHPVLRVRVGAATDAGTCRDHNEDAYVAEAPVFAVADGMGGHKGGAEASRIVVDELSALTASTWASAGAVHDAVAAAAERIRELSDGSAGAPGSTLSGAALAEQDGMPCWLVFNVGDSRTYRLQGGRIEQVTVDHTRVQEMVDAGRLTADEARTHNQRNVITRAIGAGTPTAPKLDLSLLVAGPDDRLLICSDGLTGELTEQLIAAILLDRGEPQEAADALVREAVAAGGRDNITAVVVDVVELVSTVPESEVGHTNPDPEAMGAPTDTLPDALVALDGAS